MPSPIARLIAVVVLLPLLAVLVALGIPLVRDRRLVLGGGFLWFFVVYCLFFSIAAGTHVLEGKRTVVAGFEDATPSNVLGLSRLGDWHYAVAPRAPAANDLLVITLPSFGGRTVDEARQAEIGLIANGGRPAREGDRVRLRHERLVADGSSALLLDPAGRERRRRGRAGVCPRQDE